MKEPTVKQQKLMSWIWPLVSVCAGMPDEPGRFGTVRKYDVHTGVDLYAEPGTLVQAVEDGVVVAIEDFTGPRAGSPWWNDTQALLVEGLSGVVVYGEICVQSRLQEGVLVRRGDCLGHVVTVLRKDKGRPRTMLHLELMRHGSRKTVWWNLDKPMPPVLDDPTEHLEQALRESS